MAEFRLEEPDDMLAPDDLEHRLDALGRAVVTAEAVRAEPPRAYVQAARQRGIFARGRVWVARLAVAAAVVIVGITATFMLRSTPTPPTVAPPIARTDPAAATSPQPDSNSTLAELTALNRDVTSPDQLRLPTPSAPVTSTASGSTMRASDSRSPERIDAILSGK